MVPCFKYTFNNIDLVDEFYKKSPRIEFSYNAKNWMILLKCEDEDEDKIVKWYLGRND